MANKIHPTAIIEGDVQLGDDNEIGPYAVLYGPLKMGSRNLIGPHVTIGMPGADTRNPRHDSSGRPIVIGDDNIIREFCGIQKPCFRDVTRIGSRTFIMQGVNISHDVLIHDDAVVTALVSIAGVVRVLAGANLGASCSIHQFSVVGQYTMIAMGASVTKNVRPFIKFIPGKPQSLNDYAIRKYGFADVRDQIASYIDLGIRPADARLQAIVDEFETLSAETGRKVY